MNLSFFNRKFSKETIFNIVAMIDDKQGDVDLTLVFTCFGKSIKLTQNLNSHKPYILYWKLFGKRYWESQ